MIRLVITLVGEMATASLARSGEAIRWFGLVLAKCGTPPKHVKYLTIEQWAKLRAFLVEHSHKHGAKSAVARWASCDLKTITRHMRSATDKISWRGRPPTLPTGVETTIVSWLILMFQMCCCIPVAVLCAKVFELTRGTG